MSHGVLVVEDDADIRESLIEILEESGFPTVGAANGRNPIPIVIPCHRVVGANGSLTGFGGGLEIKRQLLALEARYRRDSLFRSSRQ